MKTLGSFLRKLNASSGRTLSDRTILIRSFVETGDERCPIAGIWSRIAECDTLSEDPELTQPAIWSLLLWRAFHLPLIASRYSTF